jgi:L-lactate dehydrogenase complex protein LldG
MYFVIWFYKYDGRQFMLDRFHEAAEATGAVVKRFTDTADAVSYVRTLSCNGMLTSSALPAEIKGLFTGITFAGPRDHADTRLCVSFAQAGIAETGSLLLTLTDPTERGATALPVVHAVFLAASTIVPDLYALHEILTRELEQQKSAYLSITTGPSRTADIERVLTIGVHGPKELHIVILENA